MKVGSLSDRQNTRECEVMKVGSLSDRQNTRECEVMKVGSLSDRQNTREALRTGRHDRTVGAEQFR